MIRFVIEYLTWHYSTALQEFWIIWGNFLWFGYHFFSLPLLARTFLAPVYRLQERSTGAFDIGRMLGDFVVTTLMRIVGMIMRVAVIIMGLFFELVIILLGAFVFFFWLILPICVPFAGIAGILIFGS